MDSGKPGKSAKFSEVLSSSGFRRVHKRKEIVPLGGSPRRMKQLDFRIEDSRGVTSATKANRIKKGVTMHADTYDSGRNASPTSNSLLSTQPRQLSQRDTSLIVKDFQHLEDFENIENLGAFVSRKVSPGKVLMECSQESSENLQEQDNNFAEEIILSIDAGES